MLGECSLENLSDLKRERDIKQLFSFSMARRDIKLAQIFLNKFINANDKDEREAFVISLYVIYGRIFSKNFNLSQLSIQEFGCKLTADEKSFHDAIISLRNQIFAHTDAKEHNIQISIDTEGKIISVPSNSTAIIECKETASSLFDKLLQNSNEKIDTLLKNLYIKNKDFEITKERSILIHYFNGFCERYFPPK